jgi:hypothetical protein
MNKCILEGLKRHLHVLEAGLEAGDTLAVIYDDSPDEIYVYTLREEDMRRDGVYEKYESLSGLISDIKLF